MIEYSTHIKRLEELTPKMIDLHSIMLNLFKHTKDLIAINDAYGRFVIVSDRWYEVLGYTEDELLSKTWLGLVHPNDVQRTKNILHNLQEEISTVDSFFNRCRCKDGSYLHFCWSITPTIHGYNYSIARKCPFAYGG